MIILGQRKNSTKKTYTLKQSFTIKSVNLSDRDFKGSGVVGRVQVEDIDLVCLQRCQGLAEDSAEMLRSMGTRDGGEHLGSDLEVICGQETQSLLFVAKGKMISLWQQRQLTKNVLENL